MKHIIKFPQSKIFFLLFAAILQILFLLPLKVKAQINNKKQSKTSIIVITDLYHPYQDPGDNFDLIMPYALPELDLKAIILDVTDAFRKPVGDHPTLWPDPRGPREAGIIPVMQLNYIFNRNIPFACGPFNEMKNVTDKMLELPAFQEAGIDLLLNTLRKSQHPIEIVSFGSARPIAVAYNREPELLRKKIKRIHLSGGTASPDYKLGLDKGANAIPGGEWNVALDVNAFVRLLRSDLPIAIYPCAGKDGGFVLDKNNTYWRMPNLEFIRKMDIKLQRYLNYNFLKVLRYDFLRAMDIGEIADSVVIANKFPVPHHIWETAVWVAVSNRILVQRVNGDYLLIPVTELLQTDKIIPNELKACKIYVRNDGRFKFNIINSPANFSIYYRNDPQLNEKAFQQALPKVYISFRN